MIKLIVSDLDGTLLHTDFTYTKRTMNAIKVATRKGIRFLPASGRSFQDIQAIFQKEGISCGAICINGAQVCDELGNVLYENALDMKTTQQVIQVLKDHQLSVQVFSDTSFYAYQDAKRVAGDMQDVVSRNMNKCMPIEIANTLQEEDIQTHTILKLETMNLDETLLEQCRNTLKYIPDIEVTSSVRGNLEITHKQSTKGQMLEKLIKDYNITKEEVLIFGDSLNDLSMFTLFPNTIAVANAKNCIKEIASTICEACEEDGVAKYIEEYVCK